MTEIDPEALPTRDLEEEEEATPSTTEEACTTQDSAGDGEDTNLELPVLQAESSSTTPEEEKDRPVVGDVQYSEDRASSPALAPAPAAEWLTARRQSAAPAGSSHARSGPGPSRLW